MRHETYHAIVIAVRSVRVFRQWYECWSKPIRRDSAITIYFNENWCKSSNSLVPCSTINFAISTLMLSGPVASLVFGFYRVDSIFVIVGLWCSNKLVVDLRPVIKAQFFFMYSSHFLILFSLALIISLLTASQDCCWRFLNQVVIFFTI